MAYEITPWKKPGCTLTLRTDKLSDRESFSSEINIAHGEGGALNASYTTLDAAAKVANALGWSNLRYGVDFVFKTGGSDVIILDFLDEETLEFAKQALKQYLE